MKKMTGVSFLLLCLLKSSPLLYAQEISWEKDLNEITFKIYAQKISAFYQQGKFTEAIDAAEKTLSFAREVFDAQDFRIALTLTDLARLHQTAGRNAQAESLHKAALKIFRRDPQYFKETAASLDSLGLIEQERKKYRKAESFYKRAWALRKKHLGLDDPGIAVCLNNLAGLYRQQKKYERAERYYKRALEIWENRLLPLHPNIAKGLNNLGVLYQTQWFYDKALPLLERAAGMRRAMFGAGHPQLAVSLYNLAGIYLAQGRFQEAEMFYKEALGIWEKALGPHHAYISNAQEYLTLLSKFKENRGGNSRPLPAKTV